MKAISEFQFADVGPPAKTKRSGFRPAGELSFHPNAGLSPAIVSRNSRPRDFTLAGRRFIRRFPGIVTSASMPTKVRRQFFSGHRNGAEPDARANDQGWHASCRATSRASPDRGSSLTFGKRNVFLDFTSARTASASEEANERRVARSLHLCGAHGDLFYCCSLLT